MPVCTNKECKLKGQEQPSENFRKSSQNKSGFRGECRDCSDRYQRNWIVNNPDKKKSQLKRYKDKNLDKIKSYTKDWWKRKNEELDLKKLLDIKNQNFVCPGCGENFSDCSDKVLRMVFEKSHVHSKKCNLRKIVKNNKFNEEDEYFWSCRECNNKVQHSKCGYWLSPNNFNQTCE